VRLLGEKRSDGDATLTRYLGASYSEIAQTYATNALGFSSSPIVDERLETQLFSLFVGAEQQVPIRKGLAFVVGGEAGIFYADSRLKGTQDPSGVYGGAASTATLSVTRGDTEWGPRLKAKTGFLLTADDGKSSIGLYGQADYINNMAYIDNPNTTGESLKISNGDTLSYSLNVDFTWWF